MLEIRRVGPKIGVEIRGIDVKTMDDDDFAKIYQAWLDCNIMCVRGQELTIPDFIRYSERFGPVTPHPSKSTRHPEHPKITMLGINKYDSGQIARGDLSPRRRRLAHRRGL
jgi:taurine dioxygenase